MQDGHIYRELDKKALSILLDREMLSFPINLLELCKKMGINVIKYSEMTDEQKNIIRNNVALQDGCSIYKKMSDGSVTFTIFYNDSVSIGRQRMTIAHEIKHYIYEETNPTFDQEKYADHFARSLLVPQLHLILNKGFDGNLHFIAKHYQVTNDVATNALKQYYSRIESFKYKLFDYENKFIRELKKFEIEWDYHFI